MVRKTKDNAEHPVRAFISGLVGVVVGAEDALAAFDRMAKEHLDGELLIRQMRDLGKGADKLLGGKP